ncbi:MAG: histidine phosphatase family protein [Subtercola sp.]|nr:histidine phosphatase family protein [Subtercola sp.]
MGARELWLVGHGESVANVAAAEAELAGWNGIVVDFSDADVPLAATGQRQADALGGGLTTNSTGGPLASVWPSPYCRARQTIEFALERANSETEVGVDERLRDRGLGILDLASSTTGRRVEKWCIREQESLRMKFAQL